MTTSARKSRMVTPENNSFLEESKKHEGVCAVRMASPHHSSEESYYEEYESDHSNAHIAGKSNDRESRKNAEKQRRTILNSLIGQLSNLLPLVSESAKKIDKTSILRLAANFLRIEHVFGDTIKPCHSEVGSSAANALLDLMGGFLITTTVKGIIMVVSPNVMNYLGYSLIDLLGNNILNITHPEDIEVVKQNLTFHDYVLPDVCPAGSQGSCYPGCIVPAPAPETCAPERRDFFVRLARAASRSEPSQYALCRVDGSFRRADRAGLAGEGRLIRRQRVRRDRTVSPSGNDVIFVGVVRILGEPYISDRLLEASNQEYWTRHLVDGRIVHCDQRISLVAGYMSEEVTGVSAFTFMHKDDVRWVIIAIRQMYDENKLFGESCYRLVSRTGQFLYLRTKGFLEIDRETKAAQSFVCINSLVSDEDGMKMISDMKKRYSAFIDGEELDVSLQSLVNGDDEMEVENPQQLEQAIIHLITNLPSPGGAARVRRLSNLTGSDIDGSPSQSPHTLETLTIIPPTPSTIKSSIVKSISVMSLSGVLKKKNKRCYTSDDGQSASKRYCLDRVQGTPESDQDYG